MFRDPTILSKLFYSEVVMRQSLVLCLALLGLPITPALADTLLASDDGIIRSSLCVGIACANSETFGDNTILLKEDNLRIEFNDTSTAAGFPSNDWRIVANASNSGGYSYLAFQDVTANRLPFVVRANARDNALYVSSQGSVGFGTAFPAALLHAVRGDTPTLRLQQAFPRRLGTLPGTLSASSSGIRPMAQPYPSASAREHPATAWWSTAIPMSGSAS